MTDLMKIYPYKQAEISLLLISFSQSQSHIATDGQSVCLSWCRAPSGAHEQIVVTVLSLGGRPL
jgi:hypothetical protein